jgi:hypothetical protein
MDSQSESLVWAELISDRGMKFLTT